MAIRCSNCGQVLPGDDTHFCTKCGAPVPSHPVSSPPSTLLKNFSAPPGPHQEHSKWVLPEQIAQQPPALPARHPISEDPSTQTEGAGKSGEHDEVPSNAATDRPEKTPTPVETNEEKPSFPPLPPHTEPPIRELHVKIWEQPTTLSPVVPGQQPSIEDSDVDHLPTTPMKSIPPEQPQLKEDSIEDLPTLQMPTTSPEQARVASVSSPEQAVREQGRLSSASPTRGRLPAFNIAPPSVLGSRAQPQNRLIPLAIVGILLVVFVIGGVGVWIWRVQPFNIPAITEPQQSFRDTQLGFALLYPNGWGSQIDRGKSTAQFFDSSHTAQVKIAVADAADNDITKYLQQQAVQLGMTGVKAESPLSFAGLSWQQIQGGVLVSGANYTGVILAAVHGNHLYTITQLAPQSVYSEEEKVIFSPIRTSLQLL
ncbi:MAG: hypothetical protein JOZ18_12185 [Chloroflexi bacterium]|nr:hypothetical protein [Chloroflexota bacterium]